MAKRKKKRGMNFLDWVAIVFLTLGGINWGLVSWFSFDLVTFLSFGMVWIDVTLKSIVFASAIYTAIFIVMKLLRK